MGSAPVRRYDPDRAYFDPEPEVPLHDRYDQSRHRMDALSEGADPRQALLHLLRAGRGSCAASGAKGMDRQVQGQVRHGMGSIASGNSVATEEIGRRSVRYEAGAEAGSDQGLGHPDS